MGLINITSIRNGNIHWNIWENFQLNYKKNFDHLNEIYLI